MVLKLNCVLCLVAIEKIHKLVLVHFPEDKCNTYEQILDNYRSKHLEFLYNADLPFPEISSKNIAPSSSYTVEVEMVKMNFASWKACRDLVKAKGLPLPATKHIIPRLVVHWNATKSTVDVLSRFLRHATVRFSGQPGVHQQ